MLDAGSAASTEAGEFVDARVFDELDGLGFELDELGGVALALDLDGVGFALTDEFSELLRSLLLAGTPRARGVLDKAGATAVGGDEGERDDDDALGAAVGVRDGAGEEDPAEWCCPSCFRTAAVEFRGLAGTVAGAFLVLLGGRSCGTTGD